VKFSDTLTQARAWLQREGRLWYRSLQREFDLGVLYYTGEGVPQDDVQAYQWFHLAAAAFSAKADQDKAVQARKRVAARMTLAQIAERKSSRANGKSLSPPLSCPFPLPTPVACAFGVPLPTSERMLSRGHALALQRRGALSGRHYRGQTVAGRERSIRPPTRPESCGMGRPLAPIRDDRPERHSRRRSWPSPPRYNPPESPQ